ncbi:MAG: DUF3990 domain-containing protein [Clostridia bacterium]|nr:DUF3990 domain-containing protein [Clostridia bacterium]
MQKNNVKYIYHGTYCLFDTINLKKCSSWKDFGQGFYGTLDFEQAKKFANKKVKDLTLTNNKNIDAKPYVLVFEYQDNSDNKIYEFNYKDKIDMRKWFKTIYSYRNDYIDLIDRDVFTSDIIIGKIADDGTKSILTNFQLEDINDEYILDKNISKSMPNKLKEQICFKTNKAIKTLKFTKAYDVKEGKWVKVCKK